MIVVELHLQVKQAKCFQESVTVVPGFSYKNLSNTVKPQVIEHSLFLLKP